ncbi:mechanosensitive ion channel family protein [Teichococcus rhizosphaerae]|uniref:mechanosensitive ion channel family protein n=1 Tax=Teichococcus rhizosphaerae TaxID=1335062 RepID=UPI00159BB747|nr:mechanosensitive ion channel domain-containing protein [Pseudoroseomonas rhizosphaerae]
MSPRAPAGQPGGFWALAVLATLCAGLWLLSWLAEDHLLLGGGPVQSGLRVAATLSTALLVVLGGGRAVLGLGLSAGLGVEPTGLQRAIAYSVLTFAASAVVLASLGFDITAVLTTSAILTAAVGLALQPTLGSLISGVALHMDRVLHVGDAIVLDGQKVEILRLDWRTAIALRRDGALIVIPNARICNETVVMHRGGQPVRQDSHFPAPASLPPQRISDLVTAMITDFPQVDVSRPVMVMLEGYEPGTALARYNARYWVRNMWDGPEIGSEVLRRVWYVYQRHGIPWPVSRLYGAGQRAVDEVAVLAPGGRPVAETLAMLLPPGPDREARARRLAEAGRLLLFAPDERLILPEAHAEACCLLLAGHALAETEGAGMLAEVSPPPPLRLQRLGRAATLRRMADALARHIGPYAEHAVRQAAARSASLAELCRDVAEEIPDPARRAAFLAGLDTAEEAAHGPGHRFRVCRDAAGRLVSDPPLRAVDEVAVLVLPGAMEGLLGRAARAG